MTVKVGEILEREGVKVLEKDLRTLAFEELQEHFGAASSGRIIVSHVIKSVVWQAQAKIRAGEARGVDGNLRSFFYQWIKPVMAKIPGALSAARDPYDTMLDVFAEMVGDYKLFSYSDLDLTDESWEHRRLGSERPEVIVFAEKVGFWRWLKRVQKAWPVTVVALGGTPSLLSSEYLLRDLGERVDLEATPLELLSVVDWDPSGWQIERAFARQLERVGAPAVSLTSLVSPALYFEQEREIYRYPLPKKQQTKNRKWLAATGGLDGEGFGLESDAVDKAQLTAQLVERLEGLGVEPIPDDGSSVD